MRTRRLLVVLLVALIMGSSAGYLAWGQMRRDGVPVPAIREDPRPGAVRLAIAAKDLQVGSVLRTEDIRLVDWPSDVLPAGYASSPAELVGRGLLAQVRANEPLLADKLASREAGGGLPILIPEGMRAVSVRVDEVIQVAGFVTAGTRVDVLVTLGSNDNAPTTTRLILQNVRVLAAGQTVERDVQGTPKTVTVITLLVSPEDAERLTLAATQGRIQLALRGMLDMAEVTTAGARLSALLQPARSAGGGARVTRVETSRGADRTIVETYRGGVRTLNTFQ